MSSRFIGIPQHPCTLFPCDPNAESCVASGLSKGDSRDRTCGPCRNGFELRGTVCVNLLVESTAADKVGSGNVELSVDLLLQGLQTGVVTADTYASAAEFTSKVANV